MVPAELGTPVAGRPAAGRGSERDERSGSDGMLAYSLKGAVGRVRRAAVGRALAPLLTPLLVLALLLCHATLEDTRSSVIEPAPPVAASPHHAEEAPADGHPAEHSVEHSAPHAGSAALYAALFASLFALLLRSRPGRPDGTPESESRRCPAPSPWPGRAPTALRLRVLRL